MTDRSACSKSRRRGCPTAHKTAKSQFFARTPQPVKIILPIKSLARKMKQGKLVKIVRDHYLWDGIYCSASSCKTCSAACAADARLNPSTFIIPTNVVPYQINLLENPTMDKVDIFSVVPDELKNKKQ